MSKWKILKSSNLRACRYDRTFHLLVIEFKHGGVWVYAPVPWSVYMKFLHAKSHGSFFSANIRENDKYQSQQVTSIEVTNQLRHASLITNNINLR